MKKIQMLRTAVLAVLFLVVGNIFYGEQVQARQQKLADELIRFHVRANSDSEEDRQLKLKVRDTVVEYMENLLCESDSVKESQQIITANMEQILTEAMKVIHANGYEYDLTAYMVEEYFPLRTYGNVALPPGVYTAFRIDIGEAKGQNWWCVLYPPLCFVDVTHGVMPDESKTELENILVDEDIEINSECVIEFKYLKFLNQFLE